MPTLSFPAGERPSIRLQDCSDDLQITGGDAATIDVQSGADEDDLQSAVHAGPAELLIEGLDDSVTLRVPRGAAVVIENQGGDITIANVAEVQLQHAEGDVRLRSIDGSVTIDGVEGDCVVERVGQLTVAGAVEGDLRVTSAASVRLGPSRRRCAIERHRRRTARFCRRRRRNQRRKRALRNRPCRRRPAFARLRPRHDRAGRRRCYDHPGTFFPG